MNNNTNITPKMTAREKVNRNIIKLAFDKHGPAVNHNHLMAEVRKLKEMDFKKIK